MRALCLLILLCSVPGLTSAAEPGASDQPEATSPEKAAASPGAPGPVVAPEKRPSEESGEAGAAPSVSPIEKPAPQAGRPARKRAGPSAPANEKAASEPSGSTGAVDPRGAKADDDLAEVARSFYSAMLARDVERLVALSRAPFFFEGKSAASEAEIRKTWSAALMREQLDPLRLWGVELYTPEEMIAKHGKVPEKLSAWPIKGAMLSVGNLSGHAAVVLWKKTGSQWQALGFHD